MNKEELKFKIDQLRKDKIIYGVEATATNLACVLVVLLAMSHPSTYSDILIIGSIIVGVAYTLFMGIGNFKRLQKIKELEKKL